MKKYFTYLVATLLFGLCILEKESFNKDSGSESHEKNQIESLPESSEMPTDENLLIRSTFQEKNTLGNGKLENNVDYQNITSTDSVSFYLGTGQDKIY